MYRRSATGHGLTERSASLRVLTLNCGSSTLKFEVLGVTPGSDDVERIATGAVERIGSAGRAFVHCYDEQIEHDVETLDHRSAFNLAYQLLEEVACLRDIEAIGHRVVHGGLHFRSPTKIDADVIAAIREVSNLAPLHNDPALAVIEAAGDALPDLPMVAAFDTAYFADLPEIASRYAIPKALSDEHGIRRFGFHGLAHGYMAQRFELLRPDVQRPRLITLQLGGGCSATASFDGRPVETSMGYTPLEGLIMGTRSGNIDPALPLRLQALTGRPADEIETLLNKESGLLGLAGRSEMRDLVPAASMGDEDAAFAVDAFCASVKKYIGAYMALLGGADGLVFGGGIGENMPDIRRRICEGLEWTGIELDVASNEQASGEEFRISDLRSSIDVWVVHVDESAVMARETAAVLTD